MTLKETLENYKKLGIYPFHMPGHKRRLTGPYLYDMTEVEGVDDLHDAKGPIEEDQKRLAKLYRADKSFMLVGGSTVGNLAAIYGCLNEEDVILIQRNSHKSVYNGATLRHLKVGYIYPKCEDGIYKAVTLQEIKEAVNCEGVPKAIVITSPTYEGFLSPIDEIADYCHKEGIILLVDAAHGAHLGFHERLNGQPSGIADVTIMSLHKTLPALTQTAALHVKGNRVSVEKIKEAIDIFETSSPSYVLMESISTCLDILEKPGDLFVEYVDNLKDFYSISGQLKHLKIITVSNKEQKDPGKLIISTKNTNITGVQLARTLREKYKIETELSSFSYLLAMTSIMDSREGFERLKKALLEIDENLSAGNINVPDITFKPIKKMEGYEAKSQNEIDIKLADAEGKTSAAMVCLYPPGAPVIVPGEMITIGALKIIEEAKNEGIHVTGINNGTISVVN